MSCVNLMQGDCLELMKDIPDGSIDLILTDLPYGNMKNAPSTWGADKTKWDAVIEPKKVYAIANRILRKNGKTILFSQEPYTTRLITEAIPNLPFNYRNKGIRWYRWPIVGFDFANISSKRYEFNQVD